MIVHYGTLREAALRAITLQRRGPAGGFASVLVSPAGRYVVTKGYDASAVYVAMDIPRTVKIQDYSEWQPYVGRSFK